MLEPEPAPSTPKPSSTDAKAAAEGEATGVGVAGATDTAKKLTPEEQMALYEESLKEADWGHQPC